MNSGFGFSRTFDLSTPFYKAHLCRISCFLSAHFTSHELVQPPPKLFVLTKSSVFISWCQGSGDPWVIFHISIFGTVFYLFSGSSDLSLGVCCARNQSPCCEFTAKKQWGLRRKTKQNKKTLHFFSPQETVDTSIWRSAGQRYPDSYEQKHIDIRINRPCQLSADTVFIKEQRCKSESLLELASG